MADQDFPLYFAQLPTPQMRTDVKSDRTYLLSAFEALHFPHEAMYHAKHVDRTGEFYVIFPIIT